ncbi:hypothetical protein [Microseira wollei]|nr:hypothetical protein [Microseira wollei]
MILASMKSRAIAATPTSKWKRSPQGFFSFSRSQVQPGNESPGGSASR